MRSSFRLSKSDKRDLYDLASAAPDILSRFQRNTARLDTSSYPYDFTPFQIYVDWITCSMPLHLFSSAKPTHSLIPTGFDPTH